MPRHEGKGVPARIGNQVQRTYYRNMEVAVCPLRRRFARVIDESSITLGLCVHMMDGSVDGDRLIQNMQYPGLEDNPLAYGCTTGIPAQWRLPQTHSTWFTCPCGTMLAERLACELRHESGTHESYGDCMLGKDTRSPGNCWEDTTYAQRLPDAAVMQRSRLVTVLALLARQRECSTAGWML